MQFAFLRQGQGAVAVRGFNLGGSHSLVLLELNSLTSTGKPSVWWHLASTSLPASTLPGPTDIPGIPIPTTAIRSTGPEPPSSLHVQVAAARTLPRYPYKPSWPLLF